MATGKPEKGDASRADFIRERFGRYYSEVHVPPPGKLSNREFGVITERGGMWRHLGFGTQKELHRFLARQVPLHVYHSSAYYGKPNARTMEEKIWQGADLIFDLDADHIQGTENMAMEEMFAAVKVQFEKLVHEFLLGDFGFNERDVKIVFSGGRGYHAHVGHEKVQRLNSHERREIVDYITLPNPDVERLVQREIFDSKSFQGHDSKKYMYKLYPVDTPGWKGKTTRGVLDFIKRTEKMSGEEIIREFTTYRGIGDTIAFKMYESLYLGKEGHRGIDKIAKSLSLEQFPEDSVRNLFINHIVKDMSVRQGGETDEPVTSDIKRLIRLPGSLHGKTGLVVRDLDIDELKDFLPLRDAVWSGFGEASVRGLGLADMQVKLKNRTFRLKKNRETDLPEYAALFFACRKIYNIIKQD